MNNDYGKKIAKAFEAIYQLHNDVARLLQDCDGTIGKGKPSIFGSTVTRDLSQAVYNPGRWMPAVLYRYYDGSQETTFEREKEGRWKHVKYPGWIQWADAPGGLLIAEIRTKVRDHEWQIMEAFIGYLDRHLGEQIDSISVYYR
jgi:hypothetical protein